MQNKNVFAALISVGNYESRGIANLPTYRMDLAMIGTALENGLKVPADNIRIVAGEENNGFVTTTALAHVLADFRSRLGSDDIFVFYFSGHGRNKNIVLSNGQVELQSVIDFIDRLPARSRLVILDCCYSGDFTSAGARTMHFEDLVSDFAGKGIAVLASSAADEVARPGPNGNHSMFTGALSAAINLHRKVHKGRVSINDIYDETMFFVNAWNHQNPGKEQHPIFRSSIGGTLYFQVEEYHPYQQMKMNYDTETYRLIRVKPLSSGTEKRLAAFAVTKAGENELPEITKEIAEKIKYAKVYESEASEMKFEGCPARAVWVYFGREESDIINSLHFAYTIWAADEEVRRKYFRENRNASVRDGIYVFENTSYEIVKKLQQPTKTRESFIAANRRLLASIVSLAERFVYDLQEVANRTSTLEEMQMRYQDWFKDVNREYLQLTEEDVAPDDLHDWSEAIIELAGWVSDMSLLLENRQGGGRIGENGQWLMKHAVEQYHESMEKLKSIHGDGSCVTVLGVHNADIQDTIKTFPGGHRGR